MNGLIPRGTSLECGGSTPLCSQHQAACYARKRRQAAAGQSGVEPPHSKERPPLQSGFLCLASSLAIVLFLVFPIAAQSPEILKVDPPSWWVQSSMNPVRVLIRGRNLTGAKL